MSVKLSCGATVALALFLMGVEPTSAHTIVGDRLFPATLTIDDPGVNDELALPTFTYMTAANPDGTPGAIYYTLGWEYAKTITADLGVSVGSEGHTWRHRPYGQGWANIDTQLKYVFYQIPQSEFIFSGAVSVDWADTGSPQSASLPSAPFSTVTGKLFMGKGFGDASIDWVRPFALTAEIDYNAPLRAINTDGSQNPYTLNYGMSLQYSFLYMNSYVKETPDYLKRLIPSFEGVFSSPVSNIAPSSPDDFSNKLTTGVVGPAIYYIGPYFQVGVMAQIPINTASGKHPGVRAVVDFYLDDIAPNSIGKPLFGAPQARGKFN